MKYIVMEVTSSSGVENLVPITFPDVIIHADMAEYMEHLIAMKNQGSAIVRSAGFVTLEGHCFGESESLGLSSHADDSKIIHNN